MKRLYIIHLLISISTLGNLYAEGQGVGFTTELYTGSVDSETATSAYGAVTLPIASPVGLHIEALADRFDEEKSSNFGGHLYWRDADRGLFGLIASHSGLEFDGLDADIDSLGLETEIYLDPFSFAAQYARLDSDMPDVDGERYLALDAHWSISDAWYLQGGTRRIAEQEVGYAELSFIPRSGRSPLSLYGGATWDSFESQYLGLDYAFQITDRSYLSLFLEADRGEDDFDGLFVGISWSGGPRENAPLISLFETLKGGY
jgi:hypothetical protein